MRMKNEQRYGGIIRAQTKDLGVLLPKGLEDEEGKKGVKNLNDKKDCIMCCVFVPDQFLKFHINLFAQLGHLIVNQFRVLALDGTSVYNISSFKALKWTEIFTFL